MSLRPTSTAEAEIERPVSIEVELFGVPRVLAGGQGLRVEGGTLGDGGVALGRACPAVVGRVLDADGGWLVGGYTFVVDERFTRDRGTPVTAGSAVLLVSSVAGG